MNRVPMTSRRLSVLALRSFSARASPETIAAAKANFRATHEVFNLATNLEDYNLFTSDPVLSDYVKRVKADWAIPHLEKFGKLCGQESVIRLGFQANKNPPQPKTHDRFGNRVDQAEFHPAYHELMEMGVVNGVSGYAWNHEGKSGDHVARAVLPYIFNQVDSGVNCPLTMTYACIPSLRNQPDVAKEWIPRVTSMQGYDPRDIPSWEKKGATIGMSMTEKQGGSDVRTNSTRATPLSPTASGSGEAYSIVGHKWFTSAPMCDAFLMLAKTEKDLAKGTVSCFLIPRWLPDGTKNRGFNVMRLKDKLGDKSNASSEVEYNGAYGVMIGTEMCGIQTIIEMVTLTRLDCTLGSSSIMRQAVSQAMHYTHSRSAFGKVLSHHPLMKTVLADLAVEAEAASILALRLAEATGNAPTNQEEALFGRVATAAGKYYVCKRAPGHVYEAMECLGGNGYVEDSIMPRLFRQSPLNSIWEGSGNVICMDILRAAAHSPQSIPAFIKEVEKARGRDSALDAYIDDMKAGLRADNIQYKLRSVVDKMAIALQGSLLVRFGHPDVAAFFIANRVRPRSAINYGAPVDPLSPAALDAIIARSMPNKQ